MAFKLDTMRIFRAMRAAGLDPQNPEHQDRFMTLMREELEKLPARVLNRFTEADANKAMDKAGDRVAGESGMEELRKFGQDKDPSALFELTQDGKKGRERRAATRGENLGPEQTSLGPAYRWGHTNDPEQAGFPVPPEATNPRPGATYVKVDPDELWKEAKRQGKL